MKPDESARRNLPDLDQAVVKRGEQARSLLSPWVQRALARQSSDRSSGGGPPITAGAQNLLELSGRVANRSEDIKIWDTKAGPDAPLKVGSFSSQLVQRLGMFEDKYSLETRQSSPEESTELVLGLGGLGMGGLDFNLDEAPQELPHTARAPAPSSARSEKASPQPPKPSVSIFSPPPVQRKDGVRPRSHVEEITSGGRTAAAALAASSGRPADTVQRAASQAETAAPPVDQMPPAAPIVSFPAPPLSAAPEAATSRGHEPGPISSLPAAREESAPLDIPAPELSSAAAEAAPLPRALTPAQAAHPEPPVLPTAPAAGPESAGTLQRAPISEQVAAAGLPTPSLPKAPPLAKPVEPNLRARVSWEEDPPDLPALELAKAFRAAEPDTSGQPARPASRPSQVSALAEPSSPVQRMPAEPESIPPGLNTLDLPQASPSGEFRVAAPGAAAPQETPPGIGAAVEGAPHLPAPVNRVQSSPVSLEAGPRELQSPAPPQTIRQVEPQGHAQPVQLATEAVLPELPRLGLPHDYQPVEGPAAVLDTPSPAAPGLPEQPVISQQNDSSPAETPAHVQRDPAAEEAAYPNIPVLDLAQAVHPVKPSAAVHPTSPADQVVLSELPPPELTQALPPSGSAAAPEAVPPNLPEPDAPHALRPAQALSALQRVVSPSEPAETSFPGLDLPQVLSAAEQHEPEIEPPAQAFHKPDQASSPPAPAAQVSNASNLPSPGLLRLSRSTDFSPSAEQAFSAVEAAHPVFSQTPRPAETAGAVQRVPAPDEASSPEIPVGGLAESDRAPESGTTLQRASIVSKEPRPAGPELDLSQAVRRIEPVESAQPSLAPIEAVQPDFPALGHQEQGLNPGLPEQPTRPAAVHSEQVPPEHPTLDLPPVSRLVEAAAPVESAITHLPAQDLPAAPPPAKPDLTLQAPTQAAAPGALAVDLPRADPQVETEGSIHPAAPLKAPSTNFPSLDLPPVLQTAEPAGTVERFPAPAGTDSGLLQTSPSPQTIEPVRNASDPGAAGRPGLPAEELPLLKSPSPSPAFVQGSPTPVESASTALPGLEQPPAEQLRGFAPDTPASSALPLAETPRDPLQRFDAPGSAPSQPTLEQSLAARIEARSRLPLNQLVQRAAARKPALQELLSQSVDRTNSLQSMPVLRQAEAPGQSPFGEASSLPLPGVSLSINEASKNEAIKNETRISLTVPGQIQRSSEGAPDLTSPAPGQPGVGETITLIQRSLTDEDSQEEPDLEDLARQIYPIIRRMIAIERERGTGYW